MALQTLSDATPTEAIHWPDVLRRAARAAWQQAVEIDDCPRQNSAYRSGQYKKHLRYASAFLLFKNKNINVFKTEIACLLFTREEKVNENVGIQGYKSAGICCDCISVNHSAILSSDIKL